MIDIFYFDKGVKKGNIKDLARLKNKKIWIDATDVKRHEADLLRKTFELHPVTEEDLLLSHGRIKVEQFPNYLFCTFYSIEETKSKKRVKLLVMDYVIGNNFIISTHKKEFESYERLKKEKDKLAKLFKEGVESIFHKLLDEQIDEFFPVLEVLDDEIEELDEKIATMHSDPELLTEILEAKRKIVEIKKITFPQREKISFLAKRRYKFIPESSHPYFRDIYDQAIRVSDVVENYRESIGSTFDAFMTSVANSTNDIMKVLSIIATVALPLTVISGIYGTNFLNLPGSKDGNGFWIMVLLMAIMVVGMMIFFKRRRWF